MSEMSIGKYTYGNPERKGFANRVTIGNFCSIAEGVTIDSGFQHNTKYISTFPFKTKMFGCDHINSNVVCNGDVNIGNDIWIGQDACIMSGVTIGDGAVIGMRSIICKDIPPYAVVVGAPQKTIRFRFNEVDIQLLLQMRWWNWPDYFIKEAAQHLMNDDINALYNYYQQKFFDIEKAI